MGKSRKEVLLEFAWMTGKIFGLARSRKLVLGKVRVTIPEGSATVYFPPEAWSIFEGKSPLQLLDRLHYFT